MAPLHHHRSHASPLARRPLWAGLLGMAVTGPVAAAPQPDPAQNSSFAEHAAHAGLTTCRTVFSGLGEMLVEGTAHSVETTWNSQDANAHAVQALVGLAYEAPAYQGKAAGILFAAPTGDGCAGQMVRVAPFSKPCADVVKTFPAGTAATRDLSGTTLYNLGENRGQAMLLATEQGCIVISVAHTG